MAVLIDHFFQVKLFNLKIILRKKWIILQWLYNNANWFFFLFFIYWRFPCIYILIKLNFIYILFILFCVFILLLIRNIIHLIIYFIRLKYKKLISFLLLIRILLIILSIWFNRLRNSYRNVLIYFFLVVLIKLFFIPKILNLEIIDVCRLIFLINCINRFTQISKYFQFFLRIILFY